MANATAASKPQHSKIAHPYALMWAPAEGHAEVVQALLAKGADAKAASKSGFTPLIFAAVKNDAESV